MCQEGKEKELTWLMRPFKKNRDVEDQHHNFLVCHLYAEFEIDIFCGDTEKCALQEIVGKPEI